MRTPTNVWQEKMLRRQAEETSRFKDLVLFYQTLGAKNELKQLISALPSDSSDRLYLDLALLEEEPSKTNEILEGALSAKDPWIYYSLTKFFLKQNQEELALRAVTFGLQQDRFNVSALNLLIKYYVCHGKKDLALRLLENSLALSPQQEDIAALRHATFSHDLYIDLPPKQISCSFYMPVYNVEKYIQAAIEGVFLQNYPLDEVIVVDDGTPDNSIEIARQYPVTILRHEKNRGLAAARNTAVNYCKTDWLGSIDTDAHPDPDYMRNVVMELENASPKIAGVGGRLIENSLKRAADRWRVLAMPQHWGDKRICPVEFLFGSNAVFRVDAIRHVGGYDERFRTNAEDTHLCAALRNSGYQLIYIPWAVAYHERTDTIPSVLKTVWNWFHAAKEEQEVFTDADRLFEMLFLTLDNGIRSFMELQKAALDDLLYIQFAYLVHEILMDIQSAASRGGCSYEIMEDVKQRLFDAVAGMDKKWGGELEQRLRCDLAHVLEKYGLKTESAVTLPDNISYLLAQFGRFCSLIDFDTYQKMVI
ncbi:MAG TPA: glycosyltransferase [Candidatus Hydrogenedentes bacterium]|nr:glycosyltransferase [Candidatus Hydrogenedentota bacterium]HOL77510.1 glycosyltransferase [Candidatus Hydrogenedentota bacterium]HPO86611.1 glycosyltransferase [Candidatus Hydrogenedentota bacterium]